MAVNAIANSIGKNKAKTGINKVPRPNPEKRVKPAPKRVTSPINRYSTSNFIYTYQTYELPNLSKNKCLVKLLKIAIYKCLYQKNVR